MKRSTLLVILLSVANIVFAHSQKEHKMYTVVSPDKQLEMTIEQAVDGSLTYSFEAFGAKVIDHSALGFELEKGKIIPGKGWEVAKVQRHKENRVWKPIWGKRAVVPDKYNELLLTLNAPQTDGDGMQIAIRAYNDGVAFRYIMPQGNVKSQKVLSELTAYNFAGNYVAWFYNGENHNIGPEHLTETDGERLPVMTVKTDHPVYLALHEACLEEGEPLRLESKKGTCLFHVTSKPKSLFSGYQSAWRVILCGKEPGALVDSHLLELLNPDPSAEFDFSWVKPGMALWDWRINGATWDGFTYEMSYPSWIKMVDFASEQGFNYLVLDANWYGPEFAGTSDPTKGDKVEDVKRLIRYGKQKEVGIWLYLNDVGGRKYPLEETLKQYGEWGAAGVKYGFMKGNMEEKNQWTKKVTEICAKNHLLVDFHDGPVHPYGQMRTWPNAVTREFCHAQLDGYHVFVPETFVTSVFVNMVAGPIDMNNGMFELHQGKTTRVDNNQEVPSTLVSEAARTLITYSGVTILPDIPEYYRKYPSLLRFLSAQKMPWQQSKTLSGEIGKYIVMMRQAADGTYLVGAATNEEERYIRIPLSFLEKGVFELEWTEDGSNAHYLTNREVLSVSRKKVSRKDTLEIKMAPGGGACLKFVRLKK